MSSEIVQDEFCDWLLKKDGQIIIRSKTPYFVTDVAVTNGWITRDRAIEICIAKSIPIKFCSSLSELGG